MIDFGFGLSRSSAVNLDNVDLGLYRELERLVPEIRSCMACGSCSATCTAAFWSGMSVRKLILALQRMQPGAPEETPSPGKIGKMLSACMLCGKCTMVCPRGINTRLLVLSLCRIYKKQ